MAFKAGVVDGVYYDANTIQSRSRRFRLVMNCCLSLLGSFQAPIASFARVVKEIAKEAMALPPKLQESAPAEE